MVPAWNSLRGARVVATTMRCTRAFEIAALAVAAIAAPACRGAEAPVGPLPAAGSAVRPAPVAAAPVDAAVEASAVDAGAAPSLTSVPCADERAMEGTSAPHDALSLTRVAFRDLPGWTDDDLAGAVASFARSCEKLAELADD